MNEWRDGKSRELEGRSLGRLFPIMIFSIRIFVRRHGVGLMLGLGLGGQKREGRGDVRFLHSTRRLSEELVLVVKVEYRKAR